MRARPLPSIELGDRSAMKRKAYLAVAIMFVAAITFATAAKAAMTVTKDRRVALVIGNSAYRNATHLPNTINDANAVAALFRSVGFEVVNSRTDLGVLEFKRAVRDFLITAESADIAVVYYAGHGIEVNGTNYLIPADAKLARDYDVEDEAVALDRIIWALQSVKRLRLILLDACRDNPFVAKLRSVVTRAAPKGGLAKIEDVSPDTLIAYAAKAGSFSYDGDGPNSPFASALIRHVAEPGLDIRIALGRVRDEVLKATGGRQEPFIYGSLGGATIPLVPSSKNIEPAPAAAAREFGAPAKPNASLSPVEPNRVEKLAPAVGTAKPPQPTVQAALEKDDSARACIRDEQRLAQLRSNPVPVEIARFQRDLACTRLYAQVQRLFESAAAAQPASTGPPPQISGPPSRPTEAVAATESSKGSQTPADSNDRALACRRDELRLTQLRSNPVPDEIARFQRELSCRQLHAQVQRLFESVATGPPASAPPLESVAPAEAIRRSGPVPADGRQARGPPPGTTSSCALDAERLARLREDPTLEAIARFEKELGCEPIRHQLQRLRESIGQ
jgi:Caspase domain